MTSRAKGRRISGRIGVAATLLALSVLGAGAADSIIVSLDQAKVARMPANAQTLIVGNPAIADVTMLKSSGTMVITGKGYGETNLIALDKNGDLVAESAIRVRGNGSVLLVQRGMERESYSCAPQCVPSIQLGDGKMFESTAAQITARNNLANPGAAR
jgi:Flp pilus assembly secretin CpaC